MQTRDQPRAFHERLPVSLILAVSMVAAGVVYPVTDSALNHTSPIMIATLRALAGGALLTILLPFMGSRLPRTRRLWMWTVRDWFRQHASPRSASALAPHELALRSHQCC